MHLECTFKYIHNLRKMRFREVMCKILHLLSGSGGIQTQIQLQSLPFHFNSIMEVENDLGEARKSRKNMVNG